MRKWLLIGGAGAVVGYVAVYFALDIKPTPDPEPEQPAATAPAEPVVLADVVEVTNLDPLLDPRSEQPTGVPFDATEPPELSVPTGEPVSIPPAVEEPVDQHGAAPRVDPSRVVWYGDGRFPRQIDERPAGFVENFGQYYSPSGFRCGVSFHF